MKELTIDEMPKHDNGASFYMEERVDNLIYCRFRKLDRGTWAIAFVCNGEDVLYWWVDTEEQIQRLLERYAKHMIMPNNTRVDITGVA